MYRWEIVQRIASERVVAIVRSNTAGEALQASRAIRAAGMRVIELTLTTPDCLEVVKTLKQEAIQTGDDVLLGVGTVLDAESAGAAIRAGASFLVSPGLVPDVIRTGHRYGVPVMPGATTPTDILAALEAGVDLIKVFPASSLGPEFIRAVRAALPQAALIPTGGVSAGNAAKWLEAGAAAVGVGGSLTTGDPATVMTRARELMAVTRIIGSSGAPAGVG